MPENLGEIAARLMAERGGDPVSPVVSVPRRPKANRKASRKQLAHIEDILLHLLNHEESGTVRIAAAKVLLDRLGANGKEDDELKRRADDERAAAICDAQNIMAEFAAARTASVSVSPALDSHGATGTADAADTDTKGNE